MPPKKDLCRNFLRGSCQYGDRCRYLHAAQTPSKPNPFGFGMQTGNQFQQSNLQQQRANPFGFGVQTNSQSRGASEFGSKQNQFKWTRSSQINAGGSSAARQPDNQPASHKCTDPESCKRQILEDFENERPLWKLTCYGHFKNGPCDILGDISYEELRAAAYDDAKRGLSLQSIVERERNELNSKLVEFENLLHSPYKGSSNSPIGLQSPFPASLHNAQVTAQSNNPPSFSSFGQLGTSFNGGVTAPNNLFGQPHPFQNTSQTSSMSKMNASPFQSSGSYGSQLPPQTFQSPFASSSTSFNNSSISALQSPFFTSTASSHISNSTADKRAELFNGSNFGLNAVGLSTDNIDLKFSTPGENLDGDNSIWTKQWSIGEIPEVEPPAKYCR